MIQSVKYLFLQILDFKSAMNKFKALGLKSDLCTKVSDIVNIDIHMTHNDTHKSTITNHMLMHACKCRIQNFGMSNVQFSAFQAPVA